MVRETVEQDLKIEPDDVVSALNRKVLFLVADDWYFVSHRLIFARHLLEKGYEVSVACRTWNDRDRIIEEGIRLLEMPFARERVSPLFVVSLAWQLRKLIRREQPACIHVVTVRLILIVWMATMGMRRPVMINAVAGMGSLFVSTDLGWRLGLVRALVKRMFSAVFRQRTAINIWQNRDDFEQFTGNGLSPRNQSHLIPGVGIDYSGCPFQSEPDLEIPVVVYVGRLLRDKGVIDLLEASCRLERHGCRHELRMIGTPDPCNPGSLTEEDIKVWTGFSWIKWLGRREDVVEQMRMANIVPMPSYREGLPQVLLEAGLAGRPVVTNDVPGCRDVIVDGLNGLLAVPRKVDSLAERLQRLMEDRPFRLRMGEANYQRVKERFSQERVFDQLGAIYESFLPLTRSED